MPFFSPQGNFHLKSQRELTVLQQNYSIDIVHWNFLKVLGAVQKYRLAALEGAIVTLASSSEREVGQPWVHIV